MEDELLKIIDHFYQEYLIAKYFNSKGPLLKCGYELYKINERSD